MKILAPVSKIEEIDVLIKEGANELYCGFTPGDWAERFGKSSSVNRRLPGRASFSSLESFKSLVDVAHNQNVPVFLTVNKAAYSTEQYAEVVSLIKAITEQIGIDALIVADPGLILALRENSFNLPIHASSISSILNSESAKFFKNLGVSRIIFPRYLSIATMEDIIKKTGNDLEYEAFILNDGCVFEEGYCNALHSHGGAFCHNVLWSYKLHGCKQPLTNEDFWAHIAEYRKWLWMGIKNCGDSQTKKEDFFGMCGLCAIPRLENIGVSSLKIVGREAPLKKKESSVRLLKTALGLTKSSDLDNWTKTVINMREIEDICLTRYMCYYR